MTNHDNDSIAKRHSNSLMLGLYDLFAAGIPRDADEIRKALAEHRISVQWHYVNEDTRFWNHSYRVSLYSDAMSSSPFVAIVSADHDQDALDAAVDAAEEAGQEGLFLDDKEADRLGDGVTYAGNHGRPLSPELVHIEKLD